MEAKGPAARKQQHQGKPPQKANGFQKKNAIIAKDKGAPGSATQAGNRGIKRKATTPHHHPLQQDPEKGADDKQGEGSKLPESKGPANKKRRARIDRARTRPGFEMVERAKSIWGSFRTKRMDKEERERMSAELFGLIQGKLHQLAVKHDAARVVQCALKHANPEQRSVYFKELLQHVLDFSKIQYSHFIVLRLINVCSTAPERKLIVRAFSNQVSTLSTHAVGAKVLDALFSSFPRDEARVLRMEMYGKEVMLLLPKKPEGYDLKAVLEELPEHRARILAHVAQVIQRMLVKGLVGLVFVQELIWEYFCCCGPKLISEMVPNLTDVILLLTGTRPGAKVLSECAAYGSPKERKKMLKSLKGFVVPTFFHKDAYLFLLRLADVVDDTVAFNKTVWQELLAKNEEEETLFRLATHPKASKVLLHLLAPQKKNTFLALDELALLEPALLPPTAVSAKEAKEKEEAKQQAEDSSGCDKKDTKSNKKAKKGKQGEEEGEEAQPPVAVEMEEEEEDRSTWVPTSKKSAEARREELLAPLREPLLALCKDQALALLCSSQGSFVLFEVVKKWGMRSSQAQHDAELLPALARIAAGGSSSGKKGQEGGEEEEEEDEEMAMDVDEEEGEEEQREPSLVREDPVAYKTIKRLVLAEMDDVEEGGAAFSRALCEEAGKDWMAWLGSVRGGFLVEALAKVKAIKETVLGELSKSHKVEVEEAAAKGLKGAAAVLAMINGEGPGGNDKKRKNQQPQQQSKKGGGGPPKKGEQVQQKGRRGSKKQ